MGIDIYMRWSLMTEADISAQYQGFDVTIGCVGYLREAYHGEPYATRELVPEAFDAGEPVNIPAATLRERLPKVMSTAMHRERQVYKNGDVNEDSPIVQSFVEFVTLAEKLEAKGHTILVEASY